MIDPKTLIYTVDGERVDFDEFKVALSEDARAQVEGRFEDEEKAFGKALDDAISDLVRTSRHDGALFRFAISQEYDFDYD